MKKIVPFIVISYSLSAQIKGVVVDENNKPIPYVNIWIENENIGTTSEEDGSFNLDIKNQDKNLIFSAIGFEFKSLYCPSGAIITSYLFKSILDNIV